MRHFKQGDLVFIYLHLRKDKIVAEVHHPMGPKQYMLKAKYEDGSSVYFSKKEEDMTLIQKEEHPELFV